MTHRFFVSPPSISNEWVSFREDQVHQMRHVLRLGVGDVVRVFDGVLHCDRLVELVAPERGRVAGECGQAAEPVTRLVAYPALLQRDKFESVLQKLTEVGVVAVAPVITARGLVREAPDERRCARWQAILREAAEQCGRGHVPALLPSVAFAAGLGRAEGRVLVAYEEGQREQLSVALADRPAIVSAFVGPEGGFTADEAGLAKQTGARLVRLGPRTLRAETASPLLAALVLYELGDLQ
jgi:16S rRNA (uracil1498-N3)-methyltransferase